ncbi:hypothetical protein [Halorarum salinum]|uniref:Uncharacterized protein n=1 Tax=Halorarum salinum TaxID=2743089 RepID=A0A7D5LCM2_9EURY|nr:hypothetical protein [Halobaculum salinum]QLG62855.1 hypothetical protein HUG12_14410 [Halobaculum salinum]
MSKYEYVYESFRKSDGRIEIPEEAVGITTDYFGDLATVHYLMPVEGQIDRDDRPPTEDDFNVGP